MTKNTIKVGDEVSIEQAWESPDGHVHDCFATVVGIRKDGTLRFHVGGWRTRGESQNIHDANLQAYLNKQELYENDVVKVLPATVTMEAKPAN